MGKRNFNQLLITELENKYSENPWLLKFSEYVLYLDLFGISIDFNFMIFVMVYEVPIKLNKHKCQFL